MIEGHTYAPDKMFLAGLEKYCVELRRECTAPEKESKEAACQEKAVG